MEADPSRLWDLANHSGPLRGWIDLLEQAPVERRFPRLLDVLEHSRQRMEVLDFAPTNSRLPAVENNEVLVAKDKGKRRAVEDREEEEIDELIDEGPAPVLEGRHNIPPVSVINYFPCIFDC
jgi:hypothetical protein